MRDLVYRKRADAVQGGEGQAPKESAWKRLSTWSRLHGNWRSRTELARETEDAGILLRLSTDKDWNVRQAVASNRAAPAEALALLANDCNLEVRLALFSNPACDVQSLAAMIKVMMQKGELQKQHPARHQKRWPRKHDDNWCPPEESEGDAVDTDKPKKYAHSYAFCRIVDALRFSEAQKTDAVLGGLADCDQSLVEEMRGAIPPPLRLSPGTMVI